MKINEIGAPEGANRKTKRRGKGSGSGHGKTSCRGRKGAKKRSGRTTRPGFEGGQMQLIRRIPKRGFGIMFKVYNQVVNTEALNRFAADSIVGPAEFKEAGLIGSTREPIKVLGYGKLEKALTVKAHKFSESAKKLLTAAGAKIEYIKLSGQGPGASIHPDGVLRQKLRTPSRAKSRDDGIPPHASPRSERGSGAAE